MNKSAPTARRAMTMVGFALSCFGVLLFLWLPFGGSIPLAPKGYRFHVKFPEATQLAREADVRISGVPVGKVKDLQPDPRSGLTDATIELQEKYAPIPRDARAILRQKTLLGETYVELTPGTRNNKKLGVPENGTLAQAQVAPTVQLDEIFRAFDPKTRDAFRRWMEGSANAFQGRGQDLNDAIGNLGPTVEDANDLVEVLDRQEGAVRGVVHNTGTVFNALTARDGQLRSLITNSNRVFATTAQEQDALKAIFRVFPTFEDESRATLARLDRFARNTNPLVTQLRPAARELSPTLTQLALLAPDLERLLRDLGPLITASKAGLPAISTTLNRLRPVLGQLDPFLRNVNPFLKYIGLYKRELNTFFAHTVSATQAVTFPINSGGRPVHYLRTTNPVNPENLAVYPRRVGSNPPNPYQAPGAFSKLASGLPVFEDRHCGNGTPTPPSGGTDGLLDLVGQFFFSPVGGEVPAPPCRRQAPLGRTTGFGTGDYPHVTATPPSR